MASVVQLLLSGTVTELAMRYGTTPNGSLTDSNLLTSLTPKEATQDLLAQTTKLSCALTSGCFAGPVPESATVTDAKANDPKYRLQPRMFKHVVAGDHVDFRTGQQQDAAQFLQFLLEKLDRAERAAAASKHLSQAGEETYVSSHLFAFKTMDRLVCSTDKRIKYKESASETMLSLPVPMKKAVVVEDKVAPDQKRHKVEEKLGDDEPVPTISLQACLDSWAADATLEDFRWSHLSNAVASATCHTRFNNFPRYLLVHIQRYTLGADWTPQKLEVNLDIPEEFDFSSFKTKGPQEGEDLIPDEEDKPTSSADINVPPPVNELSLAQLMDMGLSFNGCRRALVAVGGSDTNAAMNWVFEHSTDPDFNDPLPEPGDAPAAASGDSGVDEGVVVSLVENLGCFTMDQVRAALKETGGEADQAAEWLFSHMDDLDGAIATLNSEQLTTPTTTFSSVPPLEDGDGKYIMVGMVSHIGKHTGSGHYVAHLKRGDKWVIFNDEKVALSESPPFAHAYIYLFQRKDSIGSPNPNY
jgi:ubiquitin carboxyl-terminal hydrolase 5/13